MSAPLRARIPRRAKANVNYDAEDSWFPECSPRTPEQARLVQLNRESFPFALFSLADDLLSRSIFGSKHEDLRWNDVVPDSASRASMLAGVQAKQDIRAAAELCHPLTNGPLQGSLEDAVSRTCKGLVLLTSFQRSEPQWDSILKHLLFRYGLMYRPASAVRLCKVQFGNKLGYGLRATRDLYPGVFIMETCSSMSSDLVHEDGPSIIESQPKQLGPRGARAILGPFRYGNHDCNANCGFCALSDTGAYVYVVERKINKGDEITVKYGRHGYYRHRCMCCSCTGAPTTQLHRPKRARESDLHAAVERPKKKIRRGLKRAPSAVV